jgi:hypothetical protein
MGRLIEKIARIYDALPLLDIVVPEWENEKIYYKPVTGEQYDVANNLLDEKATGPRRNAQLIVSTALNAQGARVFSDEDIDVLMSKGFVETTGRLARAISAVTPSAVAEGN